MRIQVNLDPDLRHWQQGMANRLHDGSKGCIMAVKVAQGWQSCRQAFLPLMLARIVMAHAVIFVPEASNGCLYGLDLSWRPMSPLRRGP